ncbi:hypothetical protein PCA31118_04682 [Pandoraea captiosa]|uniref:Uncharacterized protein n=1 Tax=Pandoraea captiosa TaxID=2508302 RepID=A0A5E5AMU2_9BURK|nr:hypothetical protein [Pandoraea captiosa]VVE74112.1 hypothetical protein PCA31118_04682 [Pandoraea captiosa]
MIEIPAIIKPSLDDNGEPSTILVPQSQFPDDCIAVICDGTTFTVYLPGDTLPAQ